MARRLARLRSQLFSSAGIIAVGALLASGCTAAGSRSHRSCGTSPAAVAAATDYLIARDNARDLEGVLTGYTDDVVWLPPTGEPVVGKDALRSRYQSLFSSYALDFRSETAEAVARGDTGYVRGFTAGTLTPLAAGPAIAIDDKFMAIVRCEAGVWRVSRLMWSPRAAPAVR